jgi:hypothetical protein
MLSFIIHCNLIFHALWHFFFPEGEGLRIASSHSMTNNMQLIKVLLLARLHFYMKNKKGKSFIFLSYRGSNKPGVCDISTDKFFSHCFATLTALYSGTALLTCLV